MNTGKFSKAKAKKDDISYKKRKKALNESKVDKVFNWAALGVGILLIGFVYIIFPLDLFPGIPFDDIAIGVLSMIASIITFVQASRQKNSEKCPENSSAVERSKKHIHERANAYTDTEAK